MGLTQRAGKHEIAGGPRAGQKMARIFDHHVGFVAPASQRRGNARKQIIEDSNHPRTGRIAVPTLDFSRREPKHLGGSLGLVARTERTADLGPLHLLVVGVAGRRRRQVPRTERKGEALVAQVNHVGDNPGERVPDPDQGAVMQLVFDRHVGTDHF